MRRRRRQMGKRRWNWRARLCVAVVLLAGGLLLFDYMLYPYVQAYGVHQAQTLAAQTISRAVERVLTGSEVDYTELVSVNRDDTGAITGLSSDAVKMNLLKSDVINAVLAEFEAEDVGRFEVPIGTVVGGNLFGGRGPRVRFRVALDGTVNAELSSSFTSAGINQTYHQINMTIQLNVLLSTTGHRETVEVENTMVIAQTVLIGTVPNTYLDWNKNG